VHIVIDILRLLFIIQQFLKGCHQGGIENKDNAGHRKDKLVWKTDNAQSRMGICPDGLPFREGPEDKKVGYDLVPVEHQTRNECKQKQEGHQSGNHVPERYTKTDRHLVELCQEM